MMRVCLLALALFALLATGCQNDPVGLNSDQAQTISAPEKGTTDLDPKLLKAHYIASLEAEYEIFSGLYTPGQSAFLGGVIESWPGTYAAGINLPAGALPDDYGPVTISIAVPRFKKHIPYEDQPPMVVILEPDGLEFLEPAEIFISNPPWLEDETNGPLFKIFCMQPVYADGELDRVGYSDFQWLDRDVVADPLGRLIFQVPHFSRWEADQDVPAEDTDDPDEEIYPPDVMVIP